MYYESDTSFIRESSEEFESDESDYSVTEIVIDRFEAVSVASITSAFGADKSKEARSKMRLANDTYFDKIIQFTNEEVPRDTVRYMRLTETQVIPSLIVVGIEPYSKDIHPRMGSSMSVDFSKCKDIPASIQALVFIMCKLDNTLSVEKLTVSLLTNYKYSSVGIYFLNICCLRTNDKVLKFKAEVLFLEWLYNLIDLRSAATKEKLKILCLGKTVHETVKKLPKSLPMRLKNLVAIRGTINPVWIHRNSAKEMSKCYRNSTIKLWVKEQMKVEKSFGLRKLEEKLPSKVKRYEYDESLLVNVKNKGMIKSLAKMLEEKQ